MRILITGATGFIGGAAARRLLARGDSVVVLARSPAKAAALAGLGAAVVRGDITDPATLGPACAGCDAVIHAAGLPRPASLARFHAVHVEGTRNVIAAARGAGMRRVVHISSIAAVFGGQNVLDADETLPYPRRYVDPYSATKGAAERVALAENRDGLEVTSLRPAVVWGRGDTSILPIMARLASGPGVPLCGPGTNLDATTHIENLTDAVVAAVSAPVAPGRAYFVVDDFRVTGRELLARELEAVGVPPRFLRVPRALAEPMAWALDKAAGGLGLTVPLAFFGVRSVLTSRSFRIDRARADLGYAPRVGFAAGLADLGAWVREIGGPKALIALGAQR